MSAATEQRGARLRTRASSPDILRSFALLTLLASALPATPLAAQVVEDPDWLAHLVLPKQPLNHARACTGPSWGCAEDWQRHETARAERHLEGNLAFAQASSSYGKSRVAAFSGPSPFFARAYASALDVNQIGLLNTGASAAVQTVDFYAHAKVTGTVECPYDGQGDFRWGIAIYQNIGGHWYSFAGHTKTARWNPPGCDPSHPSAEVKDRMSFDIHVPPASQVGGAVSYAIVTQLEAWSYGDFQVDARSTGSVYMPATPGVQIGTRNGFLRGQSIPDWAAPQQVVPEPSTVALTLGGIVALGIVTRRRAVRHPRPREEARRGPGGGSCGLRVTAGAP